MKILIVEDDERISVPLAQILNDKQHYVVDMAADGEEGWLFLKCSAYDLILLDVMLPKLDGIGLCQRLRRSGCMTPVLMLTAKDASSDRVMGLDAGADDYVVKPFDLPELLARIRALLRRGIAAQVSDQHVAGNLGFAVRKAAMRRLTCCPLLLDPVPIGERDRAHQADGARKIGILCRIEGARGLDLFPDLGRVDPVPVGQILGDRHVCVLRADRSGARQGHGQQGDKQAAHQKTSRCDRCSEAPGG